MKTTSKLILAICSSAILACSSPERNHRDTPAEPVDSTTGTTEKAQAATADINMDGKEKAFASNAHLASMFWQQAGTLAAKSQNKAIVALGKELNVTHQKLETDLKAIAKGKGLLLPESLSQQQNATLESLKKLAGAQFDQQFLMLLQESQASLTSLYSSSKGFQNQDLKKYADNATLAVQARQQQTARLIRQLESKDPQNLQTSPQPKH